MKSLSNYSNVYSVTVLIVCVALFAIGIPPISDIFRHFLEKFHPIARQWKISRTISEAQTLFAAAGAIELGLFDVLKRHNKLTIDQIAEKLNAPIQSVKALVDQLCQVCLISFLLCNNI